MPYKIARIGKWRYQAIRSEDAHLYTKFYDGGREFPTESLALGIAKRINDKIKAKFPNFRV